MEFQVVLAEQVACYVKIRAKGLFYEMLSTLPSPTPLFWIVFLLDQSWKNVPRLHHLFPKEFTFLWN